MLHRGVPPGITAYPAKECLIFWVKQVYSMILKPWPDCFIMNVCFLHNIGHVTQTIKQHQA